MCCAGVHFNAVSVVEADYMARVFHNGKLHTKTESQKGNLALSCIADGANHAFYAAAAKTAGDQNPVYICKKAVRIFVSDCFGINPFDIDGGAIGDAAVL